MRSQSAVGLDIAGTQLCTGMSRLWLLRYVALEGQCVEAQVRNMERAGNLQRDWLVLVCAATTLS
jgi:hypothetical protein